MTEIATTTVELPGGVFTGSADVRGNGSPVVYLHGLFGPEADGFLDDLSQRVRVVAPRSAGIENGDDLLALDSLADLVLYYDDLFDALGLEQVDLVGHSFGGMVAAEYAATFPGRVGKLVLIGPMGLWDDMRPVGDWVAVPPQTLNDMLYHDVERAAVRASLAVPSDPHEAAVAGLTRSNAIASTSHFIWPIPERGLAKRMHRIAAPTLLVWGEHDGMVPPSYADDFADRLADARVTLIPGAAHVPQVEQRELPPLGVGLLPPHPAPRPRAGPADGCV
jgi:pimeloyl-ACP methyl ester carboxylesterase